MEYVDMKDLEAALFGHNEVVSKTIKKLKAEGWTAEQILNFLEEFTAEPNDETKAAIKEAEKIAYYPNVKQYSSVEELMNDLNKPDDKEMK
ncbi:MAG: hypothetical protein LUD27_08915 [Clostridia bacterium]|nr:hypothetical protein [Clostridia bacterium]